MEINESCPDLGRQIPLDLDSPNSFCPPCNESEPSHKNVNSIFDDIIHTKKGLGSAANCDPMQSGKIFNDLSKEPNRDVIYKYSKSLRGCDEAMRDMFSDIGVIDELGVIHPVPIMLSSYEKAVMFVLQENIRKDPSLVIDRLKLPLMSINASTYSPNLSRYTYHNAINYFRDRTGKPTLFASEHKKKDTIYGLSKGIPIDIGYTLTLWTLFVEDMNQILEQIVLKFSPIAYIKVQGIPEETIVKLDSISNNIDLEPGNNNRVVKFQINMTVETYIAQPITRKKSVLQTRVDIVNSLNDDEITQIISRLEEIAEND